ANSSSIGVRLFCTVEAFLNFLLKVLDVIINRKLMCLIGGICASLFVVFYYIIPSELSVPGVVKYTLIFGCAGAFGIVVHWGFDLDALLKSKRDGRKFENQFVHELGEDQIAILTQYIQSGKNSLHFSPTQAAVQDLVYRGILYRPEQQMNGLGQIAY